MPIWVGNYVLMGYGPVPLWRYPPTTNVTWISPAGTICRCESLSPAEEGPVPDGGTMTEAFVDEGVTGQFGPLRRFVKQGGWQRITEESRARHREAPSTISIAGLAHFPTTEGYVRSRSYFATMRCRAGTRRTIAGCAARRCRV